MSEKMRAEFEKFMEADGAGYAGVYPVWKAAWAACREEAVTVCERVAVDGTISGASTCAEAIRGL